LLEWERCKENKIENVEKKKFHSQQIKIWTTIETPTIKNHRKLKMLNHRSLEKSYAFPR